LIPLVAKTLRSLAWGLAGIASLALIAFVAYDFAAFQSRRDDIDAIVAAAHPDERTPPTPLKELLLVDLRNNESWAATRILLHQLPVPQVLRGGLGWHATGVLWTQLVRFHLSADERLAIICARSYMGQRMIGFEAAAQHYFQRPLALLGEPELATLVVIQRWPSRHGSPGFLTRLSEPRDELLKRAAAARQDR
jgi:hypothetical protein